MLKRILFAMLPLTLLVASVKADDAELTVDAASITDAGVDVVEADLNVDVDQLAADAGTEKSTDAVEACFRSCGYHGGGWNYGCNNYSYGGWNSCHSNYGCYQPCYSYPSYYCVRPVYQYNYVCAPVYNSYWGCF